MGPGRAARRYDTLLPTPRTNRTRAEVARFFEGLDLLEPGVVQPDKWRPAAGDQLPGREVSSWAGLAVKPWPGP
jgi:hypothetical protein